MTIKEYNKIGEKYACMIKTDPLKIYVQYPGLLKLLGNVKGKKILDIGCGNGFFSSMIAIKGAKIVGFDVSEKQIELAKESKDNMKLNLEFFLSDQFKFVYPEKFDLAYSNMVLFYAVDFNELVQFFRCAFNSLKNNGKFISVLVNPEYKRFGELHYDRKIIQEGTKAKSEFYINGKFDVSSGFYSLFTKQEYEMAAKKAGFSKYEWKTIKIEPEGIKEKGKEFWKGYDSDPLYSIFAVKKTLINKENLTKLSKEEIK